MMPCSLPISHQGGKVEQFWRQACLQLLGKLKLDFCIRVEKKYSSAA